MTEFIRRDSLEDLLTGEMLTTETRQTLPCVVLPDSATMSDGVLAGSMISQKSRKCIAAGMGAAFNLQAGDSMIWMGDEWAILGATPLDPNASGTIIWEFGVSR
ncbi:MAG: hypothetical protein ACRCT2_05695 [Plesiomonas shigelloides]